MKSISGCNGSPHHTRSMHPTTENKFANWNCTVLAVCWRWYCRMFMSGHSPNRKSRRIVCLCLTYCFGIVLPKNVKVYEFELGFFFEHSLSWCIAFELFFLLRFRKRSSKIHWLSVLFAVMKRINRCFPNAVDNNELVLGVLWIFLANLWRTIPQNMSVNNGPFVNRNHQ